MPTDLLASIATAAAQAHSPGQPTSHRARAYAAWYLRTYARTATDPTTLPAHEIALAAYRHEIGG
jgi:hypothetical protein